MKQLKIETIKEKIVSKWNKLVSCSYVCYDVKELAYKIAYEIADVLNIKDDIMIYYRFSKDKHKIAFLVGKDVNSKADVYFKFDIWWDTSWVTGDTALLIGNAKLTTKELKEYEDIEDCIEDEEESEVF